MNSEPYGLKTSEIGKKGEKLAEAFLKSKGFDIVELNYRYKRAEIDLIGTYNGLLIFIEVKYRTNLHFGMPETFVSLAKQNRLKSAAENYIFEKNWMNDIRFDIVSIVNNQNSHLFEHFIDCF